MIEQLTKLVTDPFSIGILIIMAGALFLGKGALAPQLIKIIWDKASNLIPSTPNLTNTSPNHDLNHEDCLSCLKCIINHAVDEGEQELINNLVALLEPVRKLHEKVEQSNKSIGHMVATRRES